jgi:hypothetical protein
MLFPTNVRPETLARDAQLHKLAEDGKIRRRSFCGLLRRSGRLTPKTIW